ncbi:uncharacterized protein LOC134794809 [Cydia splendana]|uniref:uncharacterized protein LOC134794809 n=1 Tax=Cydia splendana TaxID=1100963 RepID=UPI00300C20D0
MLFTPIYIAMTFIKTWRIRSFRARLLEFLSGNTSVAFCKVPENAAETPTLSSKLCTNPKNAYLCDLLDYTNATRICSMKPAQCIEISDWVTCAGGLPLGSDEQSPLTEFDVEVLLECEMEPHDLSANHLITLDSMGLPVAWKASSHLAIVLKTNIENLSSAGFHFVGSDEFLIDHKLPVVRIQTVKLTGEPNKATDPSMRSLRSDIQHGLKNPPGEFHWPVHAALLRKLSKVVDVKSECNSAVIEMNGGSSNMVDTTTISKKTVSLADVSVNTTKSLTEEDENDTLAAEPHKTPNKSPERKAKPQEEIVVENVTVEIQHNITPKKSSLKLDLKKGTSCLSASLLNISSQIKSVTTHKRIVSSSGPKKSQPQIESCPVKEDLKGSPSHGTPKSAKTSRPLVNTKSPNILIYSDSIAARDNLEASLRKVLDADRYTIYSVTRDALETGAWRGRCALVAVAGCVGRAAPLLLAHLLDGGRLLALCSDLLHAVLPYYKTAEVRENEVVQFTFDKWKSVKMKHHIFCYQASPAKKQFSTESDRQPSKYTGHPGHELDIQVLASEETWRTPSLLQATDLTNSGVAIFSQVQYFMLYTVQYTGHPGHELDIQVLASEETWRTPSLLQATDLTNSGVAIFSQVQYFMLYTVQYTGHPGHELDIQVLASEETWRTPSLLQATDLTNSGVAIFSQVQYFMLYTVQYTGHPGHELDIQVLASEETWRTPSLLQATDLTNSGVAIFSQVQYFMLYTVQYTGHPGHELDIQVLASEETWRTPSLLQATDLTNSGVAIFSQVQYFMLYTVQYTGHPGHELDIQVLASEETWRTPSLLQATDLTNSGVAIFSQVQYFMLYTVQYTGHPGHELDIQVLASEETWRTPSLLQATDLTNSGVAIFSQIHLEADPCDYLADEGVKSNEARLEIIHKILGDILDLHVRDPRDITQPEYSRGFFLGNHVQKLALVEGWCPGSAQRVQALPALALQWCLRGDHEARAPAAGFLPVHVYECPDHFSTVEYFDNLTSKELGRLVIYADALTTTNAVTGGPPLAHGVAAVARRQTAARGRGDNAWITVPGQACISLQVWRKISPTLPLVQHAAALAAVRAVRALPAYEHLDIRIKWPNDIYYGREVKVGGTTTTANVTGDNVVCNIGTGVNISNIVPTTCVNQIIEQHNKQHGTTLAPMTIEKFLARYCSQLERILEYIDSDGGVDAFREQYYQYWLHDNEKIQVRREGDSAPVAGTVVGVDEAGWLRVLTAAGHVTVAPDGNTFDLMTGLVAPRL